MDTGLASKECMFFTAGSNQFDFDISFDEFEQSFFYNVLLQPTGLALSDTFFFSSYVLQHLRRNPHGDSWIEWSLRLGLITPYFRDPNLRTFKEVLKSLRQQKLLGLPDSSEEIAERLDVCGYPEVRYWPKWNVGDALEEKIDRYIATERIPFPTRLTPSELTDFADFWERTKIFRFEDTAEAKRLIKDRGGTGIRVSELIEATARRMLSAQVAPDTIKKLISELKSSGTNPQILRDVYIFFKLVHEVHSRNLADALMTKGNTPKHDVYSRAIDPSFVLSDEPRTDVSEVTIRLMLPSLRQLRTTTGEYLEKVRDKGALYISRLQDWSLDPNVESQEKVLESILHYSEAMLQELVIDGSELSVIGRMVKDPKELAALSAPGLSLLISSAIGAPLEPLTVTGLSIPSYFALKKTAERLQTIGAVRPAELELIASKRGSHIRQKDDITYAPDLS